MQKFLDISFTYFFSFQYCFFQFYGAARLILPDYIKNEIIKKLPQGSTLHIGSISSKTDLSLVFENVDFKISENNETIKAKKIEIEPKLSLSQPLIIHTEEVQFKYANFSGDLKNLKAKVLLNQYNTNQISIEGEINKIENSDLLEFTGLEFLLEGINKQKKIINLEAQEIALNFIDQFGAYSIKSNILKSNGEFNKENANLAIEFSNFEFQFNKLESSVDHKVIFSEKVEVGYEINQDDDWQATLDINLKKIKTPTDKLAEDVSIFTISPWRDVKLSCTYIDLFRNDKDCGRITDFLNTQISVKDGSGGLLSIEGDGVCVTPNANCPQSILAQIKSKETAQIFSKIMLSGLINPLLGGVILSGLLTSPETSDQNYEHSVTFEMKGNNILLNNKNLF